MHRPVLRRHRPPLREGLPEHADTDEQHARQQLGRVLHGRRDAAVRAGPDIRPRHRVHDEGRELPRIRVGNVLGRVVADGGEAQ